MTHAVTSGDESAVRTLLAKGADVNQSTSGGQTALILAVIFGHANLVNILVKAGADPHLRDNLGLNAIDWAQRRGLSEVLTILTNGGGSSEPPSRVFVRTEEPKTPVPDVPRATPTESVDAVSPDEKSRRWIAGLKQRLHEQELRRLNRNESASEPPPSLNATPPAPSVEEEPPPAPPPPVVVKSEPSVVEGSKPPDVETPKVIEPPTKVSSPSGSRKRCPQCNAIYNSDLVSYCAHHFVALVDADAPIISEPPKGNPPLFWILVVITLTGSIVIGSLVTTYLYKSNQASARSAAAQQQNIQKGEPEVGGELVGKAVSLPAAECPVKGPEPLSGTVIVRVMVDKNGQVYWARGSGGDWLMRGASTEAAMKSSFSPEKLRGRETEGTITYTFKP